MIQSTSTRIAIVPVSREEATSPVRTERFATVEIVFEIYKETAIPVGEIVNPVEEKTIPWGMNHVPAGMNYVPAGMNHVPAGMNGSWKRTAAEKERFAPYTIRRSRRGSFEGTAIKLAIAGILLLLFLAWLTSLLHKIP